MAAEKDISPEALETRYEAERKRKGKHTAKPQKKKSRPASITVVISEPEAIRVPFADPNGKSAKSGKKLYLSDLRDLGVEKKFISYFKSIRFEWLLNHSEEEVPVALEKEFFTAFKFKQTTDLDADSISFRLFNEEMKMSIREWSLRMGLLTPEEEEEGTWNEREIGAPKNTTGFDVRRPGG